jgi:hypothetical protein
VSNTTNKYFVRFRAVSNSIHQGNFVFNVDRKYYSRLPFRSVPFRSPENIPIRFLFVLTASHEGSVGIAMGYGLDGGAPFPAKARKFFSTKQPKDRGSILDVTGFFN